jgi:hypothetical protein
MIPNIDSLNHIFNNEDACIQFLFDRSIFYRTRKCPKCLDEMTLCIKRNSFRCYKTTCLSEVSIRKNSFFDRHMLSCSKILRLGWFWLNKVSATSIVSMTGHSSATVTSFLNYYRQLVASTLDMEKNIIGGEGVIVEIDESKIAKRKYHKGHKVEGAWVFGGIERTAEKSLHCSST